MCAWARGSVGPDWAILKGPILERQGLGVEHTSYLRTIHKNQDHGGGETVGLVYGCDHWMRPFVDSAGFYS